MPFGYGSFDEKGDFGSLEVLRDEKSSKVQITIRNYGDSLFWNTSDTKQLDRLIEALQNARKEMKG